METASVKSAARNPRLPRQGTLAAQEIESTVQKALAATRFIDMHTHLYPPAFGQLGLWGIDELLTYHYLEAEFFRFSKMTPEHYWSISKREQADAIWRTLFLENAPISEATRGIIAVLQAFDLPTSATDLSEARAFFEGQKLDTHIDKVFELSGVSTLVMTNDPLDPNELSFWIDGVELDSRFQAVLRLDRLVREWSDPWPEMKRQGYEVDHLVSSRCLKEIRRFLADWCERMRPVYMAISLPDSFQFPDDSPKGRIFTQVVLPACQEFDLPLSLMIGVRRQVNPRIRLAGDGAGKADLRTIETLCRDFPENRFFVSVLSRENQHELCVYARKFSNLMPFGCWWFMNNPSIVEEITRQRIEMLGTSFIPQHSDARVLEQLVYKWKNTRRTLLPILTQSYRTVMEDGREMTRHEIEHDVERMFCCNFNAWTGKGEVEMVAKS